MVKREGCFFLFKTVCLGLFEAINVNENIENFKRGSTVSILMSDQEFLASLITNKSLDQTNYRSHL